jgi:hypothetical protein
MSEQQTADSAAAAAEPSVRSGERTPPERERWDRIWQAHQTGTSCAGCARVLDAAEAVWLCVFPRGRGPSRGGWTVAPVCGDCDATRDEHGSPRYWLAGDDGRRSDMAAWPCDGCGRTVHAHSAWIGRSCSDACQRGP